MATASYQTALALAASLSQDEQERLIQELTTLPLKRKATEPPHSILELRGLGKEIWQGIDAQEYISRERASWNG